MYLVIIHRLQSITYAPSEGFSPHKFILIHAVIVYGYLKREARSEEGEQQHHEKRDRSLHMSFLIVSIVE